MEVGIANYNRNRVVRSRTLSWVIYKKSAGYLFVLKIDLGLSRSNY